MIKIGKKGLKIDLKNFKKFPKVSNRISVSSLEDKKKFFRSVLSPFLQIIVYLFTCKFTI